MQSFSLDNLTSNAWRTLGLAATASQADVDRAARKMGIWPDPAHIPPTPWDFPALGPVARTKNDLAQAVSRLNEPQSRVYERLLWFHCEAATKAGASIELHCCAWADSGDPAARHDAALAALQGAMKFDAAVQYEERWRRAIGGFAQLAESGEYRRWLQRVEADGDFEKRAEPDEIDIALSVLPEIIAGSLVGKANELLDNRDVAGCGRIFRLLLGLRNTELQTRVLDRIEDALDRNCRLLHAETSRRLRCERDRFDQNLTANSQVALEQAHFYNDTISPLQALTETGANSVNDQDRGIRGRDLAATALAKVALAWVWAGKYVGADQTYDAALRLAAGPSLVASIRADKEENAGRAQREHAAASQPKRVIPYNSSTSKSNTSPWKVVGGAIFAIMLVVRLLASINSPSSRSGSIPSYSPPVYTPPPSFQMPSYQPPAYPTPSYPPYSPSSPNYNPNLWPRLTTQPSGITIPPADSDVDSIATPHRDAPPPGPTTRPLTPGIE